MFNLPKWLLIGIVFFVAAGHLEQARCKLVGCRGHLADVAAKASGKSIPGPSKGGKQCVFHCHLSAAVVSEAGGFSTVTLGIRDMRPAERNRWVPDAPCAEIEHPPLALTA